MNDKEYLTIDEAAAFVGVGINQFKNLVYKDKAIPVVFERSELELYLKGYKRPKRRSGSDYARRIKALQKEIDDLKKRVALVEQGRTLSNPPYRIRLEDFPE